MGQSEPDIDRNPTGCLEGGTFDDFVRLIRIIGANSQTTAVAYDKVGNLVVSQFELCHAHSDRFGSEPENPLTAIVVAALVGQQPDQGWVVAVGSPAHSRRVWVAPRLHRVAMVGIASSALRASVVATTSERHSILHRK